MRKIYTTFTKLQNKPDLEILKNKTSSVPTEAIKAEETIFFCPKKSGGIFASHITFATISYTGKDKNE